MCIDKTLGAAGLSTLAYHTHIPTMGEWGFVLGVDASLLDDKALKETVTGLSFDGIETRFLNREAMLSMAYFGKGMFDDREHIEVNEESRPILYEYYRRGRWEVY